MSEKQDDRELIFVDSAGPAKSAQIVASSQRSGFRQTASECSVEVLRRVLGHSPGRAGPVRLYEVFKGKLEERELIFVDSAGPAKSAQIVASSQRSGFRQAASECSVEVLRRVLGHSPGGAGPVRLCEVFRVGQGDVEH